MNRKGNWIATLCCVAVVTGGCSSNDSTDGATTPDESIATSLFVPSETPTPAPTTDKPVPPGFTTIDTLDGGTVNVRIAQATYAAIADGQNQQLLVGYPVTVAGGPEDATLDFAQFMDTTSGQDLSFAFAAHNAKACGSVPIANEGAEDAGWTIDDSAGTDPDIPAVSVPANADPATVCVVTEQDFGSRVAGLAYVTPEESQQSGFTPTSDEIILAARRIKRPAKPKVPPPPRVTYKVTGAGSSALVTYTTADGDIEQDTSASLPWKKKVGTGGSFYQLSAQDSDGAGRITCEIIDSDGSVLSKHTSKGAYAIASCSSAG